MVYEKIIYMTSEIQSVSMINKLSVINLQNVLRQTIRSSNPKHIRASK
jgi:hypothetical protein